MKIKTLALFIILFALTFWKPNKEKGQEINTQPKALKIADKHLNPNAAKNKERIYKITTLAGTAEAGFSGDGSLAINAKLDHPSGIALGNKGEIYIADYSNNRIRMIDKKGIIHTIAGTGEAGFAGNGGPALKAQLWGPYGVQVGPDGLVYIADARNNRIRRIESDGRLTTVVGSGASGYGGDGGAPLKAKLSHPVDIAWNKKGDMFIAEGGGNRVRRVSNGIITTFAGTGKGGHSGDSGPATEAQLKVPGALNFDKKGNLLIADLQNHRLRLVTPEGIIHTLAGDGTAEFNGDGIKATEARLQQPGGVAVLKDGSIIVADGVNYRIRLIDPEGIIHTIAGTGERGFNGDKTPATKAQINVLDILAVDKRGDIYFTDYGNHCIRKLSRVKK